MDVIKAISNIKNLNNFVTLTQEVAGKNEFPQIPLNISTALALKKIQSFEFQFFAKCQQSGLAFMILDHILKLPSSETWRLLTQELASTFLFWLEGLRKYLIMHCPHWWTFLESLLKFINELRQKDTPGINMVNTVLVTVLADSLLDLATSDKLDLWQRLEIIRCLNHCSTSCSRNRRQEMADQFDGYFVKLAAYMARCEHVPTQLASTELLLRWLVQRRQRAARQTAARRWLSAALCPPRAVALFVESSFDDFFGDARTFLNAHNESNENVTSVICRKLTIGPLTVVSGCEKFPTWLDVSATVGCVSVLLDPRLLKAIGLDGDLRTHEILTITAEDTTAAEFYRESSEAVVSLQSRRPPATLLGSTGRLVAGLAGPVRAHVSARGDLRALHRALRRAFPHNYRCLLDFDKVEESISQSPVYDPDSTKRFSASEDDTRYSNSYGVPVKRKRRRPGFVVLKHWASERNSPSTVSTSSLLQLHEKLASLPRLRYDKEPLSVCARPALSLVHELSEPEDPGASQRRSTAVGVRSLRRDKAKTSPSDTDDAVTVRRCLRSHDAEVEGNNSLLYATLVNTSAVADSLERSKEIYSPPKEALDKDIVDEKVFPENVGLNDSGINTADNCKTTQVDVYSEIENTPYQTAPKKLTSSSKTSKCTIVSKSTSDESNTEPIATETEPLPLANRTQKRVETSDDSYTDAISQTPMNYVNVRRKNLKNKHSKGNSDASRKSGDIDIHDIEEFFSQHFRESADGNLIISPTLARKINVSSSESSEDFDQDLNNMNAEELLVNEFDVNPTDIVDCLSNVIDMVCQDFDKYNELMGKHNTALDTIQEYNEVPKEDNKAKQKPVRKVKRTPKIKLTIKNTILQKTPKRVAKGKLIIESPVEKIAVMSTENDSNDKENHVVEGKGTNYETSLKPRRKRKLYSPKDIIEKADSQIPPTEEDDIPLTKLKAEANLYTPKANTIAKNTPKSAATPYKEIEDERRKTSKTTRNRKPKATSPALSPKTQKNNSIFDRLKINVENRDLKIVDKKSSGVDIAIYNYTSDSEDEDFKRKKIVDIRRSGTTLCSSDSVVSKGRLMSKVNYAESSADEARPMRRNAKKPTKQPAKKTRSKTAKNTAVVLKELVDERMRDENEKDVDTTLVMDQNTKKGVPTAIDVEPVINCAQEMEVMEEIVIEGQGIEIQGDPVQDEHGEENAKKIINDKINIVIEEKEITQKRKRKASKKKTDLSLKKGGKDIKRNYTKLTEETSDESPLPALIIEKTAPRPDDDARSTTSSNLIKRCNRLIEDGDEFFNDTVATQNMLSDAEKINYSSEIQDYPVEIELCDKLNVSTHKEVRKAMKTAAPEITDIDIMTTTDEIQEWPIEIEPVGKRIVSKLKEIKKNKKNPESHLTEERKVPSCDNEPDLYDGGVSEPKNGKPKRKIYTEKTIANKPSAIDDSESKVTKLKTYKTKPKTTKIETIDITLNDNNASEVSIATYGTSPIRCISDKPAPGSRELNEQFESRNMELEELSPSMHDYFLKLKAEIKDQETPRKTEDNHSEVVEVAQSNKESSKNSPVVSIKRLTYDDFSKWLPSPRCSSTGESREEIVDLPKYGGKNQSSVNSSAKITNEVTNSSSKIVETAKVKTGKSGKKAVGIIQPLTDDIIKTKSNKNKHPKAKKNNIEKPKDDAKRLSAISPISVNGDGDDVDEEFIATAPEETPNYFKKITEIFSQTKSKTTTKKYVLRSDSNSSNETSEKIKSSKTFKKLIRTPQSRKRSVSPQWTPSKWCKVEKGGKHDAVSMAASGATVSSVKEWFRSYSPEKTCDQDERFACRECIENVQEKIDTTLIAIHQSTSKKFVNMFVEMEARQNEAEAKRAQMLTDLIERYKQIDAEMREEYRRRAAAIVREDCRQKRAMVAMLREDIQAVMAHLAAKRSSQ